MWEEPSLLKINSMVGAGFILQVLIIIQEKTICADILWEDNKMIAAIKINFFINYSSTIKQANLTLSKSKSEKRLAISFTELNKIS